MVLVTVQVVSLVPGHEYLRANNEIGPPSLQDYSRSGLDVGGVIPHKYQAIIPSYKFDCCGNITEWGVDLYPADESYQFTYTLEFQVWRPSPTVKTTGCYS